MQNKLGKKNIKIKKKKKWIKRLNHFGNNIKRNVYY